MDSNNLHEPISWKDFEQVELRVGTIVDAKVFEGARKPAYQIWADFGSFGIKKSSAQITKNYTIEELIGKQIVGVLNFEPKQIGGFMSEFLVTGFEDEEGNIVLSIPETKIPNGNKLI